MERQKRVLITNLGNKKTWQVTKQKTQIETGRKEDGGKKRISQVQNAENTEQRCAVNREKQRNTDETQAQIWRS